MEVPTSYVDPMSQNLLEKSNNLDESLVSIILGRVVYIKVIDVDDTPYE